MSITRAALLAAGVLCAASASAAVPSGPRVLVIARSVDAWAVRPVRGEGWNVPIEGSVVICPPIFVRRSA